MNNFPLLRQRMLILFLFFNFYSFILPAQISVIADHPTAVYQAGENMNFKVSSFNTGMATYEIRHDIYTAPIASGTVNLSANQTTNIPFRLDVAGSVFCHVTQGGLSNYGGASFAPLDIAPLRAEPTDFDAFWSRQKAKLAEIPIDPIINLHSTQTYSITYTINLGNIEGRRIYAYISVPNGAGPFPAFITLPSFGTTANLVTPEVALPERSGAISVALSVLNVAPNQNDPAGYTPNNITDKESIFYKHALLGAVRMIDYLYTRPDFDKQNLGVMGVSQGGGLAMMVAGLDQRVKLLMASNPSHAQHAGFEQGRASAFPYYLKLANQQQSPMAVGQALTATSYYDAINFAKRFQGAALILTGYRDDVNPPETVYAAFNQLGGTKIMVHTRELNHVQNPNEYWEGRLDFIRQHFPTTRNAPWPFTPSTTGYVANAGNDQGVDIQQSINLNGQILLNNQEQSLPVEWRKISGSGTVRFSNSQAKNTTAIFSQAGTYELAFIAYDNRQAGTNGTFYTIMDRVKINVNGGTVASNLTLTCNNNITVTATNSDNIAMVNWNEPHAQSTCNTGDVTLTQTSDLANGSTFSLGENIVTYTASDACGNSRNCQFIINILPAPPTTYCTAKGEQPWEQFISRVQLQGIDNESFKEQYGDFTYLNTNVEAGGIYPIILTPEFTWRTFNEYWRVWIDFNQDGDFEEANEMVFAANGEATVSGNITIPSSASMGSTRMRIAMQNGTYASPCGIFEQGEVEDYSITIGTDDGGNGGGSEDPTSNPSAPTAYLVTPTLEVNSSFIVTLYFNEPINDFLMSDLTIVNGAASNLTQGEGNSYTIRINPQNIGTVTVGLPAGKVVDNEGIENVASNVLEVNYSIGNLMDRPIGLREFVEGNPLDLQQKAALQGRDIYLYPNPVREQLNVVAKDVIEIAIYSLQGTLVKLQVVNNQRLNQIIMIDDLIKGTYFLKVTTADLRKITKRFIIQ